MTNDVLQLTPFEASMLALFGQIAGNVLLSTSEVNAVLERLNEGDVHDAVEVLAGRREPDAVSSRAREMAEKAVLWAKRHGRPTPHCEHSRA